MKILSMKTTIFLGAMLLQIPAHLTTHSAKN